MDDTFDSDAAGSASAGSASAGPTTAGPDDTRPTEEILAAWWAELCSALGLGAVPIDPDALLALAGRAAHTVVRPAAPLTTFLAGYAAGLSGGSRDALDAALTTSHRAVDERSHAS
ncbi:DUF6457 domain-containing protein [Rathayibacter tritici]|uniref:DUF6457 domain-containing protein n=1 Tax=Rathayibacter tritici TaxID=33888 RepID=UPI001C667F6E|nr:DUF6457 domain-containing protein [Rathayibacter tritici]